MRGAALLTAASLALGGCGYRHSESVHPSGPHRSFDSSYATRGYSNDRRPGEPLGTRVTTVDCRADNAAPLCAYAARRFRTVASNVGGVVRKVRTVSATGTDTHYTYSE